MLRAMRRGLILLPLVAAVIAATAASSPAETQTKGSFKKFATVPSPGSPEPVYIAPDGTIYTATLNAESGDTAKRSKVFAFDPKGKLIHEWEIASQDTTQEHGLTGMAMDADGRLYVGSL